jgi:hypothetical protein
LLQAAEKRPILILAADADRAVSFASWDAVFAVSGLTRAQQRLAAGLPDVLAIGVLDALALLRRSALQLSAFSCVVLAWPEQFDEDSNSALENLMAECDKDAQRILFTQDTGVAAGRLIERYFFKAMTFGFPPQEKPAGWAAPAPVGPARYVVARTSQFADVRRRVLDVLHPERDDMVRIILCPASREAAQALIAEAGAESPVVVIEPHQLPWLRSLFAPLGNLLLPTAADAAEQRAEKLRSRLVRVAETENLDRELMALAPLFERYDPALVAAAALKLVAGQGGQPAGRVAPEAAPTAGAPAAVPSFAKVWIGVGRKDNVKPGDLVGAIVNECKVSAEMLGKIEVRELFCLVEVRADVAEAIATGLTGVKLRGRRLTARVDRGAGPPSRRPSGPPVRRS